MVPVIGRETGGPFQGILVHKPERTCIGASFELPLHKGLTEGADEVFVNGDSYIKGVRSLDGLFKARLFGRRT